MFTVERRKRQRGEDTRSGGSRLVEPETGTEFRQILGPGPSGGGALYRLLWRGQEVLFDASHTPADNALRSADELFPRTMWIRHFGEFPERGYWATTMPDYLPPVFDSAADRDEAYMKAVEGMLVFGSLFNGLQMPGKFFVRVDSGPNAGTYTLTDFGYGASSQDEATRS